MTLAELRKDARKAIADHREAVSFHVIKADWRRDTALLLHNQGATESAVSAFLGVTLPRTRGYLRNAGVAPLGARERALRVQAEEARAHKWTRDEITDARVSLLLRKERMGLQDLRYLLGLSDEVLTASIRRLGLIADKRGRWLCPS